MRNFTWEKTHHKKFHFGKFTWGISHINFHLRWLTKNCTTNSSKTFRMGNITCDFPHIKFHMGFTYEISHVKHPTYAHLIHMWKVTCVFGTSHVHHMCHFCKGRVVKRLRKFDHVKLAMKELHWLPVSQRIMFKVATITFKVLNSSELKYLCELLNRYEPARSLRSCDHNWFIDVLFHAASRTSSEHSKHTSVPYSNMLPKYGHPVNLA